MSVAELDDSFGLGGVVFAPGVLDGVGFEPVFDFLEAFVVGGGEFGAELGVFLKEPVGSDGCEDVHGGDHSLKAVVAVAGEASAGAAKEHSPEGFLLFGVGQEAVVR